MARKCIQMSAVPTKADITTLVLAELPEDNPWKNNTHDQAMYEWWVSCASGSSMRLSDQGATVFEYANIAYYDFSAKFSSDTSMTWAQVTRVLRKYITCPYYIGVHKKGSSDHERGPFIRVYDHKTAMMISLHGSVLDYLKSVSNKHK